MHLARSVRHPICGERQLDSSRRQNCLVKEGVNMSLADPGEGGSGPEDVGEIIPRGHSGNTSIQFETWILTPRMARTQGGFHHWVVRRIRGELPKQWPDEGWDYPQ